MSGDTSIVFYFLGLHDTVFANLYDDRTQTAAELESARNDTNGEIKMSLVYLRTQKRIEHTSIINIYSRVTCSKYNNCATLNHNKNSV